MASTAEPSSTQPPEDPSLGDTPSAVADVKEAQPVDGQPPSDFSKLKAVFSILKRFIGVTDIAAVRLSLPAQLLEPIPNLEYWHYLDRPELFSAINDSDDPYQRMLACLRWWFTKDLKYVKGKPCKPYNSTLGEFFRCSWEVEGSSNSEGKPTKVNYITEQTSHHPPVSAYVYDCPDKGISAIGYDQLSAKFTGTSVKVTPGQFNKGIFIDLYRRDHEEYEFSHPAAFLGGFLRGKLNIAVADMCVIACAKTGLKTLLQYHEEGYFGKSQNRVEGIVYRPADFANDSCKRLKDVPRDQILGRFEGSWMDKIYYAEGATEFKKVSAADKVVFVDVNPLFPVPKTCPPLDQQLPNESRRFWAEVTKSIGNNQFAQATNHKTQLEDRQRQRLLERQGEGKEWQPRYFTTATESNGRPELSDEGKKAMAGLQAGDYQLAPPEEYAAF